MTSSQPRPHVVVLHRYVGPIARYDEYIDHAAFTVTYVTTRAAVQSVPTAAAETVILETSGMLVAADSDERMMLAAIHQLEVRFGAVHRLIALYEGDQLAAARARTELGIPGDRPEDVAPFRDKFVMWERLDRVGVPAVPTVPVSPDDLGTAVRFAGLPAIVKPVDGTASNGIAVLRNDDDVAALRSAGISPGTIMQPFIAADVIHVDGFFDGRRLTTWTASEYVNDCLSYDGGSVLGSVEIDDPTALGAVRRVVTDALGALTLRARVFHAELFRVGEGWGDLRVLEIGCRVGGAEIAYIWRDEHGVDLSRLAFELQLTGHVDAASLPAGAPDGLGHTRAGWLLVPPPVPRPCRVIRAELSDTPPELTVSFLPEPGTVMPDVGGYEKSGVRFRFSGASSGDVRRAIEHTATAFRFDAETMDADGLRPPKVVLVGVGGERYRAYGIQALSGRVEPHIVARDDPAWSTNPFRSVIDPADARSVIQGWLSGGHQVGVFTWDEVSVHDTAELAAEVGLPFHAPGAVTASRDKAVTRARLAGAGTNADVRSVVVDNSADAHRFAATVGYPIVVKPRSMAASVGVVRVDGAEGLDAAMAVAQASVYPGLDSLDGVLVEEYLDGPEISVDAVTAQGMTTIVNVARKFLGPAPYFEEVGHVVSPWRHEEWAAEVVELVDLAHARLGQFEGVTHTEIRLTASGPRVVEVNCRLGGDYIPLIGHLATGVDQVAAAVDVALGRAPVIGASSDDVAAVAFLYPSEDSRVVRVDVRDAASVPGIVDVIVLADPGTELRLPPRGVVPRVAAIIARGSNEREVLEAIRSAQQAVGFEADALDSDRTSTLGSFVEARSASLDRT
jgi:biotin carboxylase